MIQPDDVILALSWSGETGGARGHHRLCPALPGAADRDHLQAASTLGREADLCLALPRAKEACPNGLAPTTSTTMQLALGDALAVALLERRGFTARAFPGVPSGRQARSDAQARARHHAHGRPASRRRSGHRMAEPSARSAEGLRLRHRRRTRTASSPASSRTATCAATDGPTSLRPVEEVMTRVPAHRHARHAARRSPGDIETRKIAALIVAEDTAPRPGPCARPAAGRGRLKACRSLLGVSDAIRRSA